MSTKLRPSLQTQPTKFYLGNALCGRAAQILKNAKKVVIKKKEKKSKNKACPVVVPWGLSFGFSCGGTSRGDLFVGKYLKKGQIKKLQKYKII